ncbi:cupin superfamily protein [Ameyamaea chiangmaiensis NBRC 103196]|uniref:Cupin domain-containing protein n=1 Tax=Ameyamaea chiangmaiensis TaxID=442969 RepID=A0A850PB83_9PROT|nr:cupin domain-containing protein [Ameyamaea chiangmaiensis]MBS4075191.1 cupin domain-containing protein [Ameyamaea chiangmaiensis]NVN41208.1 cupin domain-containing protein [Ameyamaea chiangmaiensis]GBQ66361.1 cupin superfamily protein [Ameyamaea chiangmaiensis NBRC 103196]
MTTARAIIDALALSPHPEGGWYRETWRDADPATGPRGRASLIHYLLERGQRSHWHRIDATEIWLHQGGDALRLLTWEGAARRTQILGPDLADGQRAQGVVPPGAWQSAEAVGDWVLVSCVVSPGFSFDAFEMAPDGWQPPP